MFFNVMLALYCRDHFKLMKAMKTPHLAPRPPPTFPSHSHTHKITYNFYKLLKVSTDPRVRVSDLKCHLA